MLPRPAVLNWRSSTRPPAGRRSSATVCLLSSRSVELRWRCFDASGTKVWEQIRLLAWSAISVTNSESEAKQVTREVLREQARKAVGGLSIPRHLFPKIDNVKLPDSTL